MQSLVHTGSGLSMLLIYTCIIHVNTDHLRHLYIYSYIYIYLHFSQWIVYYMCIRISQKNQQPSQSSSFQGKLEMSSIYQGEKDQEIGLILLGLLELSPT